MDFLGNKASSYAQFISFTYLPTTSFTITRELMLTLVSEGWWVGGEGKVASRRKRMREGGREVGGEGGWGGGRLGGEYVEGRGLWGEVD